MKAEGGYRPFECLPQTVISAGKEVVSCDLEGESVLLDLRSSKYFRLNPVGREIWTALGASQTLEALVAIVTEKFDVEPSRCEEDIKRLLLDFHKSGLIDTADA